MKILSVSSFKGGTAKTSISLHIGSALALYHKARVLLVDFDAQANLTTGLGLDPDENDSLASVLQGTKTVKDVLLHTAIKGLDMIPADTWLERVEVTGNLASDRYSHERLKEILRKLDYDYILVDTPPSLCWLTESALIAADYSIVCATPEFYSIKGLERLAEFIRTTSMRHPVEVLGVILSFWNPRGKTNQAFLSVVERTFPGKTFETKIRRDISISEASIHGKPVFEVSPKSRGSLDYRELVDEMLKRMKNCKTALQGR